MKKIAILQPNYIPWKGVFDLINTVDVFVFFDDVQYTVKDWRSRNKIKTTHGDLWLSVPVKTSGLRNQLICDTLIDNTVNWQLKHYKSIKLAYQKAPYFKDFDFLLEEMYINNKWEKISDLNIFSTKQIANLLNITVEWVISSELKSEGKKDGERVIDICNKLGCDYFINGPTAKGFMDEEKFKIANIILDYKVYDYIEYPQLYPPFNHYVSVLDVLFNCGKDAKNYIFK